MGFNVKVKLILVVLKLTLIGQKHSLIRILCRLEHDLFLTHHAVRSLRTKELYNHLLTIFKLSRGAVNLAEEGLSHGSST